MEKGHSYKAIRKFKHNNWAQQGNIFPSLIFILGQPQNDSPMFIISWGQMCTQGSKPIPWQDERPIWESGLNLRRWEEAPPHPCLFSSLLHNLPVSFLGFLTEKPAFFSRLAMHKISVCLPVISKHLHAMQIGHSYYNHPLYFQVFPLWGGHRSWHLPQVLDLCR